MNATKTCNERRTGRNKTGLKNITGGALFNAKLLCVCCVGYMGSVCFKYKRLSPRLRLRSVDDNTAAANNNQQRKNQNHSFGSLLAIGSLLLESFFRVTYITSRSERLPCGCLYGSLDDREKIKSEADVTGKNCHFFLHLFNSGIHYFLLLALAARACSLKFGAL
jgi:hypothetical protein